MKRTLNQKIRGDDAYPRKNPTTFNADGSVETVKGTRKGAVHRVNPPGTGGIAKKLVRRMAKNGKV